MAKLGQLNHPDIQQSLLHCFGCWQAMHARSICRPLQVLQRLRLGQTGSLLAFVAIRGVPEIRQKVVLAAPPSRGAAGHACDVGFLMQ